jgi:hypothetical protein
MPAVPIIVAAAVGSGAAAAIGAAVVGTITAATISTAVATAVGVGVISGAATAVQGGSSSDILRSAVIGGTASYVGGQVASKVTSAVAQQTGASLVDLEPSLRALSGEGASAAGVASITAGNVAGAAASAAITGQPIEQAALFGLAQSIPTALTSSQDFRSLNPVVQNVLASSAQAAVMGQDVGDAAIASLVASSGIVARAIKEVPGGEQFIQQNPVYAKYVIDSVSSALTAQLQGKDVSESVLYSLARTTADVLSDKFQDAEAAKEVEDANEAYQEAQREEANVANLGKQLQAVKDKYSYYINQVNQTAGALNTEIAWANHYATLAQIYVDEYNDPRLDQIYGWNAAGQRAVLKNTIDNYNNQVKQYNESIKTMDVEYREAERRLRVMGYYQENDPLEQQYNIAVNKLNNLIAQVERSSTSLTENSVNLFTDFETELATTLAPLTAFEETDVTDQDLLAQISPVAPPMQISQLDPNISAQAEEIAREEFAKVAQGEEVAALPAVAIPAAANVLTRTAIQAAPAVVRKIGQFAANDPRFAQAVVENPYIQELLRAASLTAALGPNGELLINPIIQENESAAESARLYRYATQVQSEAVNVPPNVIQALEREARRFEDLAAQQDIENLIAPQPDMEVELTPEVVSPVEPIPEIDVRPAPSPLPQPTPEVVPEPILPPAPVEFPELLPDFAPIPRPVPRPSPAPEPATEPNRAPIDAPIQRPATQPELSPGLAEELGLLPQTRPAEEPQPRPAEQIQPSVRPREEDVVNRPIDFPEDIDDEEILRLIEEDINQPLGDITPEEEGEEGLEEEAAPAPAPEEPAAEGEEAAPTSPDIVPTITTVGRRTFARPAEGAPYRVTGMDESGILGRKQPLFGGDEDLQRAEWNRRSLRLRRLLGL